MNSPAQDSMLGQFENQTDVGSVTPPGTCEYDASQQVL